MGVYGHKSRAALISPLTLLSLILSLLISPCGGMSTRTRPRLRVGLPKVLADHLPSTLSPPAGPPALKLDPVIERESTDWRKRTVARQAGIRKATRRRNDDVVWHRSRSRENTRKGRAKHAGRKRSWGLVPGRRPGRRRLWSAASSAALSARSSPLPNPRRRRRRRRRRCCRFSSRHRLSLWHRRRLAAAAAASRHLCWPSAERKCPRSLRRSPALPFVVHVSVSQLRAAPAPPPPPLPAGRWHQLLPRQQRPQVWALGCDGVALAASLPALPAPPARAPAARPRPPPPTSPHPHCSAGAAHGGRTSYRARTKGSCCPIWETRRETSKEMARERWREMRGESRGESRGEQRGEETRIENAKTVDR